MGRISASHAAGLDLIDKLFFNQILVLCLFTEELVWLKDLDADLDRELTHKGITGVQRQVVKHGVLCMMEAELSESLFLLSEVFPNKLPALPDNMTMQQSEELERFDQNFFQATVLAMLSKVHQCDEQVVIKIANALLGKHEKAPATVRYRLVERMFAFEFMFAPIDCFTWLAKMGVLDSNKHPGVALEARYSPEFLQRLALLCELDMQRDYTRRAGRTDGRVSSGLAGRIKYLSEETIKLLHAKESKDMLVNSLPNLKNSLPIVSLAELENPASIQRFFSQLSKYAMRFRVFKGSLASWIGMLCGGYVEVLHRHDQKRLIFAEDFNKGSLTQNISDGMSARGFGITTRTIYERHRDFKETVLEIVTTYYHMQFSMSVAIPPCMDDLTYHGLIPQFDQLKPKPRRHPRSQV